MLTRGLIFIGLVASLNACSSDESGGGTTSSTSAGSPTSSDGTTTSGAGGGTSGATTSSGAGGTAGTGAGDPSLPADDSAAAITAFLESRGFEQEGWVTVHPAPEEPMGLSSSPHGLVQVYLSGAVVDFKTQEPDAAVSPAVPGAMAVKEFYDDQQSVVGYAAMVHLQDTWVYYCYGASGRCASGSSETTSDAPMYGDVSDCRFCHGGNVFTALPE